MLDGGIVQQDALYAETLVFLPADCFLWHVMFDERALTVSLVGSQIK